nr:NAD(P)/FAD-dependent oxidoreductase [Crocinitomix catalasitica]
MGSGLGGLACGNILSKAGFKVIILERNHQIGGNLQVFSRDKTVFDTGVHYIGGLDKGQNLYKIFKYFGIMDHLNLIRMDEEGFDRINFLGEEKVYKYGMGYDKFYENLVADFPEEKEAIRKYCDLILNFCDRFPMYQLRDEVGKYSMDETLLVNAKELIESLTDNERLRDVLGGTNALYAGTEKTPFYVHALVVNTYIESSWRCVDGGSQIAILMQKEIRKHGGEIVKRAEVVGVESEDGKNLSAVVLRDGRTVKGKNFISNMHPKQTIDVVGEKFFRKAYVNRIKGLKNTISSFTVHVVFKKKTFKYINHNLYYFNETGVWDMVDYDEAQWPMNFMFSTPANSKDPEYCDGASIMCYMKSELFDPWRDSFNTIAEKGQRPQDYLDFKEECTQKILDLVASKIPGFKDKVESYYASTPLTFKDYINTDDGHLYGIEKDSNDGLKTFINPKTRIPNLFLTGANINLHGILGVSISSIVTCAELIDRHELLAKINEFGE